MAFSFEKFVQKSTKGLFLFIAICMIVPLVLWGYMGNQSQERPEDKGDAGVLHGNIHVSKGEYNRRLAKAAASYWWKKYNDPMTMMMMRYGRQPEPPKAADLAAQAWEDIILLREAKANGIVGSEQESLMEMRDIYQKFTGQPNVNSDMLTRIAGELFHVSLTEFQAWVADHVVIDKLLTLISNSEFADYDKIYERLMTGHQMAKVWYAAFDPKDSLKDLKTPTTDEIAGYYQKNKEKFKVPAKVQVAYLLADADELKKKIAEPSEADVKKYYDDNKNEFMKAHEHHPGEEHKEDEKPEAKSFDEVKAGIPDRIKQKAADKQAAEIMAKVDVALGAIITANGNKYPDDIFDQLKAKFKAEGTELTYDITVAFDSKQVEDVEKSVGSNSNLGTWAFDLTQKIGDVSQKVKTSKGVALFRIQKRIEALDPGISERTRETIVKELQKGQIQKKTQQLANNVVLEIGTHGMISARLKYPLDWRLTRYFKVGGETGIDDQALGQAINQQVQGRQVQPGKAAVISGQTLRGAKDKADWSYVVYLEDLVDLPPEDVSSGFSGSRKGLDEEARKKYRDLYVTQTVKDAMLVVDPSMKNAEKTTDSNPNP